MKEYCGEITYNTENGMVHSDICHHNNDALGEGYIKFLHDCLDEWLKQSDGTGAFWVGDPEYFKSWSKEV